MIIQCRQCRTKFRFDDAQMEGDGIWMRCSHCQHVFFQDNPQILKPGPEPFIAEGQVVTDDKDLKHSAGSSDQAVDEDIALFIDDVRKVENNMNQEVLPEMEKPVNTDFSEDEIALSGELPLEEDEEEQKAEKKSSGKFWRVLKIFIWIILVIVIIPAIIYLFVFPQMGGRLIRIADKYIGTGIQEPAHPEIVTGQVKLQDIRQRILNSYVLGPIRIVEGTAVNQADYPISRVVIKGEIVDAYAVVLGERASYAGNALAEEELMTLSEDEILRRLSQPEGRNNSNDKIIPNGQIPFMIVFAREPAGVIKTTVTTIGAERLL